MSRVWLYKSLFLSQIEFIRGPLHFRGVSQSSGALIGEYLEHHNNNLTSLTSCELCEDVLIVRDPAEGDNIKRIPLSVPSFYTIHCDHMLQTFDALTGAMLISNGYTVVS